MNNNIKITAILVIISFGLNFLYIYNRNSNAETIFSENIEKVEILELLEAYDENQIQENIALITEISTEVSTKIISEPATIEPTQIEPAEIFNNNLEASEQNSEQNQNASSKININTATLQELDTLPSIGEVLANNIITYRNDTSKFNNISDIMNVDGIGEKTYEKLKDFISVD